MNDCLEGRETRTVIRNERSKRKKAVSGMAQGSVLVPIMFLIHMNDRPEGVNSYLNLFLKDTKLLRKPKSHRDCKLQKHINKIYGRKHGQWNLMQKTDISRNGEK